MCWQGVAVNEAHVDISFGMLPERAVVGLDAMLKLLYLPMVTQESVSWKPGVGVDDSKVEFFQTYSKFSETVGDAVSSLNGGFSLHKPENLFDIENKATAFTRVRAHHLTAQHHAQPRAAPCHPPCHGHTRNTPTCHTHYSVPPPGGPPGAHPPD